MNHESALLREVENLKAQLRRESNRAAVNLCRLRAERKKRKYSEEQRRMLNEALSDKDTEILELRGQIRDLESEAR